MTMDKSKKSHIYKSRVILAALLLMPIPALAYLDPTTGSMLISAIVGVIASLVLAIKTYWYRIKAFFKGKPAKTSADANTDDGAA